jgi:acyl-coenzyme A thioesterase PaaI-like protein
MPATGWSSIATGELEVSMLAETAVTGVATTTLTPGLDVEPVSLALNYLRPTRPQAGNLLARARVVNASRRKAARPSFRGTCKADSSRRSRS